jgi:methionine-gamma-lyase
MAERDSKETREYIEKYNPRTVLIHGRFTSKRWDYHTNVVPPISSSAVYRLESAERGAQAFAQFANPKFPRPETDPIYIYDRLDEPTRGLLEENLAYAEGGDTAICFSSGMAAISGAICTCCGAGDQVLAHRMLYGCTFSLLTNWLPRYDIDVQMLNLRDPAVLESAITDRTRVVYFESPANPTLELVDMKAVSDVVAKANAGRSDEDRIWTIVDNTFATPMCQRPMEHGIDIVVHSLTKGIGGFGTDMGGVAVIPQLLEPKVILYRKDFGGALSPRNSWAILVYGLPTLAHRVKIELETSAKVAEFLSSHPAVERVSYPGLPSHPEHELAKRQMTSYDGSFAPGTMVYFVVKGNPEEAKERGRRVMNHIADNALSATLAVSLGAIKTLVEHPSSMTHAMMPAAEQVKAGMEPGGIRISVGLEDEDDLIRDLKAALDSAA